MEGAGIFKVLKAACGAVVAWFLGLHVMIQLLVYAIGFDIITGVIAAWMTRSIDSAISCRGTLRKLMILLGVTAAEIAGRHLGIELTVPWGGESWGIGAAVAGYYCINETVSITENLARAGVPLPGCVLGRLKQFEKEVNQ